VIRVLIQYPATPDTRFDLAYYRDVHVPLVKRVMMSLGMLKGEWNEVLTHPAGGAVTKYNVVGVQYWESLQAMAKAYASPETVPVAEDVKKFYSGTPFESSQVPTPTDQRASKNYHA
jgi:uncharacterized protein (TIGR02118 family)